METSGGDGGLQGLEQEPRGRLLNGSGAQVRIAPSLLPFAGLHGRLNDLRGGFWALVNLQSVYMDENG